MNTLFQNILTASFHGSIVILAVMLLRLVLKKTPRKYICLLWLLAGLRLLMPFQIQSDLSLQPSADPVAQVQQQISRSQTPAAPEDFSRPIWTSRRRCRRPKRFRTFRLPSPP